MTFKLEKILALGRAKKLLILVGTMAFLFALYLWLFFLPLHDQIGLLNRRLTTLLNQKAEQEAIVENLEVFKTEYLHLQESLNRAMAQLPNKKEIPSLLESISNLGRECGLELPLFKPDKEVPKDFYAEVPVDIKILGTFPDIATFFYKIGKLPRIVTISNMEIVTPKDQTKENRLDATCRAITYRFLEANERPETGKQVKKLGRKGVAGKGSSGETGAE